MTLVLHTQMLIVENCFCSYRCFSRVSINVFKGVYERYREWFLWLEFELWEFILVLLHISISFKRTCTIECDFFYVCVWLCVNWLFYVALERSHFVRIVHIQDGYLKMFICLIKLLLTNGRMHVSFSACHLRYLDLSNSTHCNKIVSLFCYN